MSDATAAGRWQAVKNPGELRGELKELDKRVKELAVICGDEFVKHVYAPWMGALDGIIQDLKGDASLLEEFGLKVLLWRERNEDATAPDTRLSL